MREKVIIGNAELYCGDSTEIIPTLPNVHIVITSPPYNMRTRIRNGKYTEREQCNSDFSNKYRHFHDAFSIEEYYKLHKDLIEKLLYISPLAFINIQIVTGSKEAWFRLIGDFNKQIKDIIVWDKGEGQPAMHDSVINRGTELILALESNATAGRAFTKMHFSRGTMSDIWRIGRGNQEKIEGHAATFPIKLPQTIIQGWTEEGEIVLDPFMGSGTTGEACVNLGRKFIGVEIERNYFDIACERITKAQRQAKFDFPKAKTKQSKFFK